MKTKNNTNKKTKKKKVSISSIFLVLMFFTGLGIMLYPTISDHWNSLRQSRAIANYEETVGTLDERDYEALFKDAELYNSHLQELSDPFAQSDRLKDEYNHVLDVTGSGIIGYVTISKIRVELPIYHGTSEEVLNVAAGHLEGSSLPIGGKSTHSVISAHRGLPSARLFSDLDEMEIGDTFTVTVLNRILTYEVDQIRIVEPDQIGDLRVTEGMDYLTLQTCTPYGINSQRLLVRGHRVETAPGTVVVHKDAIRIPAYIAAPAVAIPILFVLLLILLFVYRRKPAQITTADIREMSKDENVQKNIREKKKKDRRLRR